MENDSLYGPPKQLFTNEETNQQKKLKKQKEAADNNEDKNEFLDDEDFEDEGFDQTKLRKYELNKLKYFYAVIHCNSKKTAAKIYEEYNGYEFELSNTKINLSFIADDLQFPQKVKEVSTEVGTDYDFKRANNLNRVLNHTKVKLTWDQTDPKRVEKFSTILSKRALNKNLDDEDEDEDEEDYNEFIGGQSEEDSIDEDDEEALQKIDDYRNKLLGTLKQSGEDFS